MKESEERPMEEIDLSTDIWYVIKVTFQITKEKTDFNIDDGPDNSIVIW